MCIGLKLPRDWVRGKSAEEKSLMEWDNIAVKNKKEWRGYWTSVFGGGKFRHERYSYAVLQAEGALGQVGVEVEGVPRIISVEDWGGFSACGSGSRGGRGRSDLSGAGGNVATA
jgi:hypothetical protein